MERYADILNAAYKTAMTEYHGTRKEQVNTSMQSANAFLFLVLDIRKNGVREPYKSRVMSHLKSVTKGGQEPCIDAVQIWSYPSLVCALTLCKHTPEIWAELDADAIDRVDHVMTAFALMSNFISNDKNEYRTGIGLKGDVRKDRAPNFRFPLVVPAIAAAHYFGGADELDAVLASFDYDAFIEQTKAFGFINMLEIWGKADTEYNGRLIPGAKQLLTEGGKAYIISNTHYDRGNVYRGGNGEGAKIPYLYEGMRADDIGIAKSLIRYNHSGGACKSFAGNDGEGKHLCYTLDGSLSVMEGVDGMMLEYNLSDPGGLRSSASYCNVDFMGEIALVSMLKALGAWDGDAECEELMLVGGTDHIHKLAVGYMSQGMGIRYIEAENNLSGYYFIKDIFKRMYGEE